VTLVKRDGSVGTGSYTMGYRKTVLARLTELEEKIGECLITEDERLLIQQIWVEETANLALKMAEQTEAAE